MYRLKVKFGNRWKMGLIDYKTLDEAERRANELRSLRKGVQIKIVNTSKGE